jgi:(5-formylfuran-3-yl)methyl phosphate synthase
MERRMADPIRLLVSARDRAEALAAADAGVDLIDLKAPAAGALGALPLATVRDIVVALRAAGHRQPVSATIGDLPADDADLADVAARVAAMAATGVSLVKVGVTPGPQAAARLQALAACPAAVVPVFIADDGLPAGLAARAAAAGLRLLMADTQAKTGGSLLQRRPADELAAFVAQARAAGAAVGLAGALRLDDLPALRRLGPDFAGFRSAVCAGDRAGALDPARLATLVAAMRAGQAASLAG